MANTVKRICYDVRQNTKYKLHKKILNISLWSLLSILVIFFLKDSLETHNKNQLVEESIRTHKSALNLCFYSNNVSNIATCFNHTRILNKLSYDEYGKIDKYLYLYYIAHKLHDVQDSPKSIRLITSTLFNTKSLSDSELLNINTPDELIEYSRRKVNTLLNENS